jgi:VIT1/CCC1 family predicted Fe2+/Mn2+ transporter
VEAVVGRHGARTIGQGSPVGGNALRAAVLGANDGLVSNFCLVMGVAGASADHAATVVAGVAGLLAGALSMALGEWLSVQSSRELHANQLERQRRTIADQPAVAEEMLRRVYEQKGLDDHESRSLAHRIVSGDGDVAVDTLAREELGIDPTDLGGSAWVAAVVSFVLFAVGATIPVVPYLFTTGSSAILASAVASALALFLLGMGITLLTGRHPILAGVRQVAFGLAGAAVTYGIGTLLGTTLA